MSTDNGATFNPFSGATSTTLTLPGVAFSMNQNRCRAVFTNASGTATSTAATLTVNRFPIPGTVIVSRYAMQAVKLPVTQITGAATDPDAGDTVSLVSVANGAHGTAQISGGYVFYMPSDQSADIFNYVIQDSRGANVMGSVTLTIKNDTTPSLNITGLTLQGDGSVAIDVSGFPGYTCGLQFKFDLADPVWTDIGPMTADQFGQGHFVDGPLPLGTTRGFYRLIHPAP